MADDSSVVNASDGLLQMEQKQIPQRGGYRSRRIKISQNPLDTDGESAKKSAGQKYLPTGSAAGTGTGLSGQADQASIFGQFVVGPYLVGNAIRNGSVTDLEIETWLGAAANVVVSGWIINMITDQPSPLSAFGLVASGAAQVGVGLFFTMAPTKEYAPNQ
jgi:hypothetical protein